MSLDHGEINIDPTEIGIPKDLDFRGVMGPLQPLEMRHLSVKSIEELVGIDTGDLSLRDIRQAVKEEIKCLRVHKGANGTAIKDLENVYLNLRAENYREAGQFFLESSRRHWRNYQTGLRDKEEAEKERMQSMLDLRIAAKLAKAVMVQAKWKQKPFLDDALAWQQKRRVSRIVKSGPAK